MSRLALGSPSGPNDLRWVLQALKTIERASFEDIETIIDDYSVTGTITEARTFDAGTASATDIRNVLATLVNDIQKRGTRRQPNEA